MRKGLYLALSILLAVLLCACTGTAGNDPTPPTYEEPSTVDPGNETTETTEPTTEVTEPEETEPEETEPTEPEHSELYLPEYAPQQIIAYFEEVVLHSEYTDGSGNPALIQKWVMPISYRIYGTPTEEDLAVLENLFAQLNEIPGFPGISPAEDGCFDNLAISFLNPDAFRNEFSDVVHGEEAFGAVQYWYYDDLNEIYSARIGYRTDLEQVIRNSVLVEEIINGLGISDTVLRTDSIVYQYSDDNLAPSDVDWVIVKLLYDPAIQCGMNLEECTAVIETLYY